MGMGCSPVPPAGRIDPVTRQPWASMFDDEGGRGRGRESKASDSSSSSQMSCPDKHMCDKDRDEDEQKCYRNYGNGLKGDLFETMLRGCLEHARTRWMACYKGEPDSGPWTDARRGIPTPGGRKRW